MGATAELNPYVWATVDDYDLDLWDRQLRDFVPPDSFDAHAHLWRVADLGSPTPPLAASGPAERAWVVFPSARRTKPGDADCLDSLHRPFGSSRKHPASGKQRGRKFWLELPRSPQ